MRYKVGYKYLDKLIIWLSIAVLTITALASLFPLIWSIIGSFKINTTFIQFPPEIIPKNPTMANYEKLFIQNPTLRWTMNSIITASLISIGAVVTSTMAGYAFGKKRFYGSGILFSLLIATIMLPQQVLLIPLYVQVVGMGFVNSIIGLIIPFICYPLGIFLIKQFSASINDEIMDASKIDGAGEIKLFLYVIVPLLKPAIASVAIFAFVGGWGEYLWQVLIGIDREWYTLPVGVSKLVFGVFTINYGVAMAGATVAFIPLLTVFLYFQRYFINGLTVGSVKG